MSTFRIQLMFLQADEGLYLFKVISKQKRKKTVEEKLHCLTFNKNNLMKEYLARKSKIHIYNETFQ
jgi:hypothetical protein